MVNLARVAQNPWDYEVTGPLNFPVVHNVEMKMASSVRYPHFQTKSLVWTMQELFNRYRAQGQYASASFVTRVDGKVLGFGSIRSTLLSDPDGNASSLSLHDGDAASTSAVTEDGDQAVSTFITNATINGNTNTGLGRRGLEIRLNYIPNGKLISDIDFIASNIKFLVLAANKDPKTGTTKTARMDNLEAGFFLEISSMGDDDELPLFRIIEVLGRLPARMYEERPGGRWAELTGLVRFDGVNIGRIRVGERSVGTVAGADVVVRKGSMVAKDPILGFFCDSQVAATV